MCVNMYRENDLLRDIIQGFGMVFDSQFRGKTSTTFAPAISLILLYALYGTDKAIFYDELWYWAVQPYPSVIERHTKIINDVFRVLREEMVMYEEGITWDPPSPSHIFNIRNMIKCITRYGMRHNGRMVGSVNPDTWILCTHYHLKHKQ